MVYLQVVITADVLGAGPTIHKGDSFTCVSQSNILDQEQGGLPKRDFNSTDTDLTNTIVAKQMYDFYRTMSP